MRANKMAGFVHESLKWRCRTCAKVCGKRHRLLAVASKGRKIGYKISRCWGEIAPHTFASVKKTLYSFE